LVPIVVRPSSREPGRWELIFGERRLRAVIHAGLAAIRAEVVEAGDADVRQAILAEVLTRKDLSAIEEAAAFQAAIDAGDAAGPTELAKQLGLSQGHVSNRLRLLELPAAWQARIISGEIPATHARSIVRYKDCPVVLDQLAKDIRSALEYDGGFGSVEQFNDMVDEAADRASHALEGTRYSYKLGRSVPIFEPTDEQRAQLGLIEIPAANPRNKAELRATNKKLWEKLQAAYEATLAKKADKKIEGSTKGTKATKKIVKAPTAAELKRQAEREKQLEKDRAEKFAKGAWRIAVDWRRMCIAAALRGCIERNFSSINRQVSMDDTLRLLAYFSGSAAPPSTSSWSQQLSDFRTREDYLASRVQRNGTPGHRKIYDGLTAIADGGVVDVAQDFLADLFWHAEDGPAGCIPDDDVLLICEQLGIDLAAAWKQDAAGELTEAFLNLRNKDGLVDVANKAGIMSAAASKRDVVAALLLHKKKLPPPKELMAPKKPRS